ncbi:autophagy protein Atg8 ubiquitin like protein [Sphaerosporella brunnea]|uniref:Autophagy-related protein n=1 Tax=Sphaerosporella brunnea TaxID=1250544 RepID=A0A5J5EFD5_9PEZI|nr:autophagy protein Atg8 ubiquitin like protein [Sphaerosporella brunnea]
MALDLIQTSKLCAQQLVPVVIERATGETELRDFSKHTMLFRSTATIAELHHSLRRRLRIGAQKALFLFVDGAIEPLTCSLADAFRRGQGDGWLYVVYSGENAFGGVEG